MSSFLHGILGNSDYDPITAEEMAEKLKNRLLSRHLSNMYYANGTKDIDPIFLAHMLANITGILEDNIVYVESLKDKNQFHLAVAHDKATPQYSMVSIDGKRPAIIPLNDEYDFINISGELYETLQGMNTLQRMEWNDIARSLTVGRGLGGLGYF